MEYICAYFDTQGFYINSVYHPIEVAMSGDETIWQVRVAKKCSCCPTKSERSQMHYLTENHHGLESSVKGVILSEVKEMVISFYKACRTNKHFLVACRSREAETMLDKFNIPFININHMHGATFNAIKTGRKPCLMHKSTSALMKCSLNLILDMENFIRQNQITTDVPF